jgi:hypothetical protein
LPIGLAVSAGSTRRPPWTAIAAAAAAITAIAHGLGDRCAGDPNDGGE